MGANTTIGWTHNTRHQPGLTLNAWIGCDEADLPDGTQHAGCDGCYAREGYGTRYAVEWGPAYLGGIRRPKAESGWQQFYALARRAAGLGHFERVFTMSLGDILEDVVVPPGVDWKGWPTLTVEQLQSAIPGDVPLCAHPDVRVRGPERERLIVHARQVAADVDAMRSRVFDSARALAMVCGRCGGTRWRGGWEAAERLGLRVCSGEKCKGQLVTAEVPVGGFVPLLLTKRPDRSHLVPVDVRGLCAFGGSVSDQRSAGFIVPAVMRTPGFALYFLSMEPLVGAVDLTNIDGVNWLDSDDTGHESGGPAGWVPGPTLDWLITGGESGRGNKPRAFHVEHAGQVLKQGLRYKKPVYLKQMGSLPVMAEDTWKGLKQQPMLAAKNAGRAPVGTVPLAFTGKGEDAQEWSHLFGIPAAQASTLQRVPVIHTTLGAR